MRKLLVVLLLFVVGCGGGGNGDIPIEPANIQGPWRGEFESNRGGTALIEVNLTQTDGQLSGTSRLITATSPIACGDGIFNGAITGNDISGTMTLNLGAGGGSIEIDATLVDGNTMEGTYNVNGGFCDGDVGSFELARI